MEKEKYNLIKAITSPLGFFALSLFIVEGFLTITLVFSDLDSIFKFYGMFIGAFLFIIVVMGVWITVWCKPKHLTFGEKGHLQEEKMKKDWGTKEKPVTKVDLKEVTPQAPTENK